MPCKGGAVVARRLLNREPVRRDLCPAPEDTGLQPIPGDKGLPILGHALAAATLPIEFLESRLETYGAISWMRGFAMPFVLALGPEASQEVFANNDHVFSQKGQEFFSGRFFNRGLMFLDFEEHHFHRRIMQEAFTRERLSGYLHSMDTICRAAAAALSEDELLVYPYLKRTLLDIATVVFMGDEPGPQSDLMNKAFTDCLHAATAVVRFPVPGLRWSAGVRSRRVLEQYFHTNIDARRTSGGDNLFAALCRARDEDGKQFTDDDVVNHMIFFMSAATDTSAAAATAVLYQLALHPEWQDRVRAESSAEIGDGRLDLDALDRMQSLGMVINESMRLFAPVPAIFRKTLGGHLDSGLLRARRHDGRRRSFAQPLLAGPVERPARIRSRAVQRRTSRGQIAPSCLHAVRRGCTQVHRHALRDNRGKGSDPPFASSTIESRCVPATRWNGI